MSYIMDMVAKAKELQKKKGVEYFKENVPDWAYDYDGDHYYQYMLDHPQEFDVEKRIDQIRKSKRMDFFDGVSREEFIWRNYLSPEAVDRINQSKMAYEAAIAEAKRRGLVPGGNGKRVNEQ